MNTREKNLANIQKQEEVQAKEEKQMNSEMQNPTSLRKQLTNKNGDCISLRKSFNRCWKKLSGS